MGERSGTLLGDLVGISSTGDLQKSWELALRVSLVPPWNSLHGSHPGTLRSRSTATNGSSSCLSNSPGILEVDFDTILFNHQALQKPDPFSLGFWRFSRKKDPEKEWKWKVPLEAWRIAPLGTPLSLPP